MAPTTSLSFGAFGQIHIAFEDVHLFSGIGGHLLTFPFKTTGTWLSQDTDYQATSTAPVLFTGTVWAEQPSFQWLAGIQPQVLALRGFMTAEKFYVDLSDDQLLALDRARRENDLQIILKLQATLLSGTPDMHLVAPVEQVSLRIPRAHWLELLHQVGAAVGITLRVPSPLTDSSAHLPPSASAADAASLAQAASRLRQARAELHDHQWEHCVATCRQVLENVARIITLPSAKQVFDLPAQNRTQEQRWAALYYDVKGMASAAHHDDGTTDGFTWTRTDAEAILASTAGVLLRYTTS